MSPFLHNFKSRKENGYGHTCTNYHVLLETQATKQVPLQLWSKKKGNRKRILTVRGSPVFGVPRIGEHQFY